MVPYQQQVMLRMRFLLQQAIVQRIEKKGQDLFFYAILKVAGQQV
jgi:hypothetical protein